MKKMLLRSVLLISLLIPLLGNSQEAKKSGSKKPAVLICSWSRRGVSLDYLKNLAKDGFVVDYLDSRKEFTWDRIKKFNVLVLYDFPNEGVVKKSPHGGNGGGPGLKETMKLLKRFLGEGGGVMINLQYISQPEFYTATKKALETWGAKAPLEFVAVPITNEHRHPRLGINYSYTQNINNNTPVSKEIKEIWYPTMCQHGGYPYWCHSGPIEVDKNWQVVVKAPKGSISRPMKYDRIPKEKVIKDAFQREDGVKEPAIFAIRDLKGRGRLALFWCRPIFHFMSGHSWIHDSAMMSKGFGYRKSDFGKLLENTLEWLGKPSMNSDKIGGAKLDMVRLTPATMRENTKPGMDRYHQRDSGNLSPDYRRHKPKFYKGLIGARTEFSGGKGSVKDYATKAKALGLNFVVFLEDFKNFSKEKLKKLKEECEKNSDDSLLLFPGYRMETNLGNKIFFCGQNPKYPYDLVLTGPNKKIFRLQDTDKNGKFKGSGNALSFNLNSFRDGRKSINTVGYYDFKNAEAKGGMKLPHLRAFSMAGVIFYDHGKLVEDVTDQYLTTNQGTMTAVPVSINLVDSPNEMAEEVRKGHALTYATARNSKLFWTDALSWNHQYRALNTYPSTGPVIWNWGNYSGRKGVYGAECFVPEASLMTPELLVTSEAGIKKISLYDGEKLFRRFFCDGAKTFHKRLFLTGVLQKNITAVVTDINGNKAVSFPVRSWKDGSPAAVYCGDHVNDGDMILARGPCWQRAYMVPQVSVYGDTWDGGPKPVKPLLEMGPYMPSVVTKEKERQGGRPYQIPMLRFCDERVGRGSSVSDQILHPEASGNSWSGWGPILPAPLFSAEATYTRFNEEVKGVHPNHWAGIGITFGPTGNLFEQIMVFKKDMTLSQLWFSYIWRRAMQNTNVLLIVGKGKQLEYARDVSPKENPKNDARYYIIPTGGWFAGVSRQAGNAQLYINRGDPFELMVRPDQLRVAGVIPRGGKVVKKGEKSHLEFFTMCWPMDIKIPDSQAMQEYVNYLANPDKMEILRGKRIDGPGGLLEITADSGAAEIVIPRPTNGKIKCMVPFRVSGMNPRWTAIMLLKEGYRGKGYYGPGKDRVREVGIDRQGRIYFPVSTYLAPKHHIAAGNPIVADDAGKELFIQVTCMRDRRGKEPKRWHISVNNPTDQPITTTLKQTFELPDLKFPEQKLTLKPGEYRVLLHDQGPPPVEPRKKKKSTPNKKSK